MIDDYDDPDDAVGCLAGPIIILLCIVFIVVWTIINK